MELCGMQPKERILLAIAHQRYTGKATTSTELRLRKIRNLDLWAGKLATDLLATRPDFGWSTGSCWEAALCKLGGRELPFY